MWLLQTQLSLRLRQNLFNEKISLNNIRFRLIVIVIADKELNSIVRKNDLNSVELSGEVYCEIL